MCKPILGLFIDLKDRFLPFHILQKVQSLPFHILSLKKVPLLGGHIDWFHRPRASQQVYNWYTKQKLKINSPGTEPSKGEGVERSGDSKGRVPVTK